MAEAVEDDPEQEEDDVAEAFFRDSGPGKNEMTAGWLPDPAHWLVKTFLDRGDAQAIASIHGLIQLNPETNLDEKLEPALDQYYEALVSEGGTGFQNYQAAIEAMHGKTSDGDKDSSRFEIVAADDDD